MRIAFSFGTALFATSLLASACVQDDDDIWMPPGGTGKADGITKIQGSTIPSQFVDPTKEYLTSRQIDSLAEVSALSGDDLAIAMRADGIIANLPANGRIEAAELARMEVPAIFATLFPNEQAALPKVWPLLEAPKGPAIQVGAIGNDMTVTPMLTPPGGLVLPSSIVIATLAQDLQTVARRVQLVFDGDNANTTIQVPDIEAVIAMPQAFTPAEVEQLKQILTEFRARATSSADARALVPEPGIKKVHVTAGAMALDYQTEVVLEETRTISASTWSGTMQSLLTSSATLTAPATDKMITIDLGTGSEHVVNGPANPLPDHGAGELVVERYAAGTRMESFSLTVPAFAAGTTKQDMTALLDYTLVLANGAQLVKNAVQTPTASTVVFHHDKTQITTPGLSATTITSAATPPLNLPPGHYVARLDNGVIAELDLYPQGVVTGSFGYPAMVGMTHAMTGDPTEKGFVFNAGTAFYAFAPSTRRYTMSANYRIHGVTLTAAMRTK